MPSSYRTVDFALRPAKNIERKMMVEAFRRLSEFGSVQDYRYVGFGTPYFSDFVLFHRVLGIKDMVSIQRDASDEERFRFNRPFSCISLHFEESAVVLPRLDWKVRTITWLDYDESLEPTKLSDVGTVCSKAVPGSVVVVTVNAKPWTGDDECCQPGSKPGTERLTELQNRMGLEKVPVDVEPKDLGGWGTAEVYRRIIQAEIEETLLARNGGLPEGGRISFLPLFHFIYADGPKMLTFGGLLYDKGQEKLVAACEFTEVPFLNPAKHPWRIDVPKLTLRELRYLDAMLPAGAAAPFLPNADTEQYSRVYRYFPAFVDAEL